MEKICFKCKKKKNKEDFYKHPGMGDGYLGKCKLCTKNEAKKNYFQNHEEKKEYDRYRHRYSIVRIFNHRYNSLKDRCTKVHKVNGIKKSVYGKKYLTKKRWLKWCYEDKNYKKFMNLYNTWVQSGFNRKLVPSIDRINNKLGYEEQNIQWLTLTENCSKHDK